MKEPFVVNRAAAILVPRKPFFDWLRSLPDPLELSPEASEEYTSVYLLPEYEDDNQKRSVLEGCFNTPFEEVLCGWWTVVDDWPNTKDYQTFAEWFDVKMCSIVCDVVEGRLARE
jgi:hypothetical protein